MPNPPDVVLWSVPAFVLLTAVELISCRLRPDDEAAGYDARDTVTSLAMAREVRAANNRRERAGSVVRGPGWQPPAPPGPGPRAGGSRAHSETPRSAVVSAATVPRAVGGTG